MSDVDISDIGYVCDAYKSLKVGGICKFENGIWSPKNETEIEAMDNWLRADPMRVVMFRIRKVSAKETAEKALAILRAKSPAAGQGVETASESQVKTVLEAEIQDSQQREAIAAQIMQDTGSQVSIPAASSPASLLGNK